jgi:hypothetical protein
LQFGQPRGYVLIDLGSATAPRWLTSRLYLLSFLITLTERPIEIVFVHSQGEISRRFLGVVAPDRVRWALAQRYSWFEPAMANAYALLTGPVIKPPAAPAPGYPNLNDPLLDPDTKRISVTQVPILIQYFLSNVQDNRSSATVTQVKSADWVELGGGKIEYSKWIDKERIERLLSADLTRSFIVVPPNQVIDDLGLPLLKQKDRYIAVLDAERTFQNLLDRSAVLDGLAREFLKQARVDNAMNISG